MTVDIHLLGIADEPEMDQLRRHLEEAESVQVHDVRLGRVKLTYDEETIDASEIQEIIERVGGQVLSMKPTQ